MTASRTTAVTTAKRTAAAAADELRAGIDRLPASGPPPVMTARQQAAAAVSVVTAALEADPTTAERAQRDLDLIGEILRRLAPLTRQAAKAIEREHLDDAVDADAIARLGLINPDAPAEMQAIAGRLAELAERIPGQVLPDWDTPRRWRELSADRMPDPRELGSIADELRRAIAPALNVPHPADAAVRLAELAAAIELSADTGTTEPPAAT